MTVVLIALALTGVFVGGICLISDKELEARRAHLIQQEARVRDKDRQLRLALKADGFSPEQISALLAY